MGMLDGLLAQLGPNFDVANLATKVGLSPEMAEMAIGALGKAHPEPGDTVATAAASTGISPDILQQIVGHIGGEGSLGNFASMLGDHPDVMKMVSGFIGGGEGGENPLGNLGGLASGLFKS